MSQDWLNKKKKKQGGIWVGGTGRLPSQKLTLEQGSGKSKNRTEKDRSHLEDNPAAAGHLATALVSLNHCYK